MELQPIIIDAGTMSIAIVTIIEALKRLNLIKDKFLQLASVILGAAIGSALAYTDGQVIMQGLILGIVAGSSTTGLYSAAKNTYKGLTNN